MGKDLKKKLMALFKRNKKDALRASIPMEIGELKDLLSFLSRELAPPCDHTLRESIEFLKSRNIAPETVVPWLHKHGGFCDCEVIFNVYDDVGDIVGWHLDEDA